MRSLPEFGRWVIAIGGVEIAHLVARVLKRRGADEPFHAGDRVAGELDARGAEERHRQIATEDDAIGGVLHGHRETLHEVLAVIAIVEQARAEEEGDGRVDRGCGARVPGDFQARIGEREGLVAGDGELEAADGGGAAGAPDRSGAGGEFAGGLR